MSYWPVPSLRFAFQNSVSALLYSLLLSIRATGLAQALGELNLCEHSVRESADCDADGASNGESQRDDERTKQRVEDLSRELANMRKSRRSNPVAGKTDDCLVIAIRPTLDTPTGSSKNLLQGRHVATITEEPVGELVVPRRRGGADSQRDVAVPASTVSIVDASSVV